MYLGSAGPLGTLALPPSRRDRITLEQLLRRHAMSKPPRDRILNEIAYTEGLTDTDVEGAKATTFGEVYLARLAPVEGPPAVDVGLFMDPRDAMHAAREAIIYDGDEPYVASFKVQSSVEQFLDS
jgi:hypothetical protein